MKSDTPIYVGIVVLITVYVVGFVAWKKSNPKSHKPEQTLFLSIASFSSIALIWGLVSSIHTLRQTGINTLGLSDIGIGMIAATNWAAFLASLRAERRARARCPITKNA